MNDSPISLKALLAFSAAVAFLAYEMALQVLPAVMTHELMHHFLLSAATLSLVSSVYFVTYTLMQVPAGMIYDQCSLKHVLSLSALICSLGLALFAWGGQALWLSLGRLLMGAGSAFAFIGVLMTIHQQFPARLFPLLTGLTQAIAALGAMIGGAPVALWFAQTSYTHVLGLLTLFGLTLSGVLYGVLPHTDAQSTGATQSQTLLKDLSDIVKQPRVARLALIAFCSWGPITLFPSLWGEHFLAQAWHVSIATAAQWVSWVWVGIVISAPVLGRLAQSQSTWRWMLIASVLAFLAISLIMLEAGSLKTSWIPPLLFLMGTGASAQILTFSEVKHHIPEHLVGTTIGLMNAAVVAGGALLQPLVGWIIDALSHHGHLHAMQLQEALTILPLCFLIASLAAAPLAKKP